MENIRYHAFDYFEQRGKILGNDWEDWLRAERQVLWNTLAEMFEKAFAIVLRVAVPRFGATAAGALKRGFSPGESLLRIRCPQRTRQFRIRVL